METYQILSTCAVGLVAFILTLKFFRSPKHLPPGPFSFPIIGSLHAVAFTSEPIHDKLYSMSKTYGSVFRVKLGATDMIVLNDYQSIQEAYHHPNLIDRPSAEFEFLEKELGGGKALATLSGVMWKEMRKMVFGLFRELGINKTKFETVILEEAGPLVREVELFAGKPFDPTSLTVYAVTNIICGVTLGKRFEYDSEQFKYLLHLIIKNIEMTEKATAIVMFPILQHLPYPPLKEITKWMKKFMDWFLDSYEDHVKNFDEDNCNDLIDGFLRENKKMVDKNDELGIKIFNEKNAITTVIDIFFAGSETTSTTMRWAYVFLVQNPHVQERCQNELDEAIGRGRLPRLSDRENVPYMRATISEVQRVANVIPLGVPHAASVDTELFGYTIPKGSMIISNLVGALMDPKVWSEPEKFKPERHLDENGKYVSTQKLIPFSTGPRECIGAPLAKMELFLFLTHLLHRFNIRAPDGVSFDNIKGTNTLFRKPEDFTIRFIPRD